MMQCRHCRAPLQQTVIDLGSSPPSNAYLSQADLSRPEKWFPLRVLVCNQCWLVQTEDFAQAGELFDSQYAYFSGVSSSWLDHCRRYVAEMIDRFRLGPDSHVVEVAANDGYLLQYVLAAGVPCTGIEPTASTAAAARAKSIPIVEDFFGTQLARRLVEQGKQADLTVANNVLAHVPDINDFVAGFALLLKPEGVATFEFPHLVRLIDQTQFDTIYHEHFSYLSLAAVSRIFESCGLSVFDVQPQTTHGGSLRVFAQRSDSGRRRTETSVAAVIAEEQQRGVCTPGYYTDFGTRAIGVKNDFLRFLLDAQSRGATVAAYGAAAKGNTLLNYAGVRSDLIGYVVDRSPLKRNRFLPGSRIPIVDEDALQSQQPDYVVILPWNLTDEVSTQLAYARGWGAKFVRAIPKLEVF